MLAFFFQAEDGIRDGHVTGVQTCALPISTICATSRPADHCEAIIIGGGQAGLATAYYLLRAGVDILVLDDQPNPRSEERRVGKECRYRCRRSHHKKMIVVENVNHTIAIQS